MTLHADEVENRDDDWDANDGIDEPVEAGLDELFGPWILDDEATAGSGRRFSVRTRGFFRD